MIELQGIKFERRRYYFFLNPYGDAAFTKCPKCESSTKIRKSSLVIHIDPQQLLLLNKKCRYCVKCNLIIANPIYASLARRMGSLEKKKSCAP